MSTIDQRLAQAGGDIVSGHKTTNNYFASPQQSSIVGKLLMKLQQEIDGDEKIRATVESLQFFSKKRVALDGIEGLEAKLTAGGRTAEITAALEMKEEFEKLLERWSYYASAQEIFAFLLARIKHEFNFCIHPKMQELSTGDINIVLTDRIVHPTVEICGTGKLYLSHDVVMGMIYWLTEQCFVRWHK